MLCGASSSIHFAVIAELGQHVIAGENWQHLVPVLELGQSADVVEVLVTENNRRQVKHASLV
jgi:hypothetical protein